MSVRVSTRRKASPRPSGYRQSVRPDRDAQKRRIEKVAEEIFAARGYKGTSVHQVANRAGCSVGHLYNLYGKKLDLYRTILEFKLRRLSEIVTPTTEPRESVREHLHGLLRAALQFFEENTDFFRIYHMEAGAQLWKSDRAFVGWMRRWHQANLDYLVAQIRLGQARGEFRRDLNPEGTAISLETLVKGHTHEWILFGRKGSLAARTEEIWDLLENGLLERRRPERRVPAVAGGRRLRGRRRVDAR